MRTPDLDSLYKDIDAFYPKREEEQPPCIGISCNHKEGMSCIAETYVRAVLRAGGAPMLIPVLTDIEALTAIVERLDGLIMSGGGDLNPLFVKEDPIRGLQDVDSERDTYDLILLHLAAERQLPIFGICRGHQLVNVAFGGSVYQDLYTQCDTNPLKHSQQMPREQVSHYVKLAPSRLQNRLGGIERLAVNSFHHQAVRQLAPEFIESACAQDGINEAFEHPEKPIFGVQWHPEALVDEDERMLEIFRMHVEDAQQFRCTKAFHKRHITIDSHTDTPMIFPGQFDLGKKEGGKVNLPFMEEGHIDATFMVAYIPQGPRDKASLQAATSFAIDRLQEIRRQETLHPTRMSIACTPEEILSLKKEGKKAILMGVENGYAIGKDLENISRFRELGVTYITLCHNGDNDICDSARGQNEWGGISPFGKEVVRQMNQLGLIVDISHAGERSFYDALEISDRPIIASHSSARALCDHPRNLTDEQLKALASQGGVVQLCLYKGFIHTDAEQASLSDAIRHINHIVELIGIDHVGIGSDFDGDGELIGCRATNELINITMSLYREGYTDNDIAKLWGGNLLRVMHQVQQEIPFYHQ